MKKTTAWIFVGCLSLSAAGAAHAEQSFWDWFFSFKRMKEVEPVADKAWDKECGSCHLAYQPGLLPARSWEKLLTPDALADHFGDSAEMDEETRKHLLELATRHAADKSYYKRSRKVMSSLDASQAPLRIIEVPSMREKHEKIPTSWVKENPKVKSLSFCDKCHQRAHRADYDDDTVVIPDHGTWTW